MERQEKNDVVVDVLDDLNAINVHQSRLIVETEYFSIGISGPIYGLRRNPPRDSVFFARFEVALLLPIIHLRQTLVDRAGRTWAGNYTTFKGLLIRAIERWDQLALDIGDYQKEVFLHIEDDWVKKKKKTRCWSTGVAICFM